jgi:alkylation response protein AidB-like acyl-CoA dehydrogenase
MNLELTPEQLALRAAVRRMLAERAGIADHVRPMLSDPSGTTAEVWRSLAELGTTGLLVPPEHGGAGAGMVEAGVVLEELGAGLHPGPWLSTAVAAVRSILGTGEAGQEASRLLSRIADGSAVVTVGPLDPTGELPVVQSEPSGAMWLRGRIDLLPDAVAADTLLVLANDRSGCGLFAVDPRRSGTSLQPRIGIDQTRKQFCCTLNDSPARLVATVDPSVRQALLDDVLTARAADALGAARAVLAMTVEHAKVRNQFGRPIGSFQAVQHLCADMYETLELARGLTLYALWAADHADATERSLAAIRVKAFAGRLATVGDTAVQVYGGLGYTWENDLHLFLKRLLSWSSFLGPPDRYVEELGAFLVRASAART